MTQSSKEKGKLLLLIVGLLAWLVPGAGHFLLNERKRSLIIFITIVLTFFTGIYVGSIGVIDLTGPTPWYVALAQVMNSPLVAVLGILTRGAKFPVYGWPNEIGQIYTSTAGLLNLLCVVNAMYLAHVHSTEPEGGQN